MGASTGMLIYLREDARKTLQNGAVLNRDEVYRLLRELFTNWSASEVEDAMLAMAVYPPVGVTYIGCFPGVEIICDRQLMVDYPSELYENFLVRGKGSRIVLHAMYNPSDWFAYAVWDNCKLIRSLSLSPDEGIIEDIGDALPFETPYWAGERALELEPDEDPYPLPFHPLQLGEEAVRSFLGFNFEGYVQPNDIDFFSIPLAGFMLTPPDY